MKTLNKNTARAKVWIDRYKKAEDVTVRTFYERPSLRKMSIEDAILQDMKEEGGRGYRILGGNSSFFTCGYKVDNKLIVLTGFDSYTIEL